MLIVNNEDTDAQTDLSLRWCRICHKVDLRWEMVGMGEGEWGEAFPCGIFALNCLQSCLVLSITGTVLLVGNITSKVCTNTTLSYT